MNLKIGLYFVFICLREYNVHSLADFQTYQDRCTIRNTSAMHVSTMRVK